MASNRIKIAVDGEVSASDLRTVVDAFVQLIDTLAAETNPNTSIRWRVSALRGGSAVLETEGIGETDEDHKTIADVIDKYDHLGEAATHERLEEYSEPVQEQVRRLTSVIGDRIPRIKMTANDHEWAVNANLTKEDPPVDEEAPISLRRWTRSAIRGRIVTVDEKQGLYFTLREAHTNRDIRCYLHKDLKPEIAQYFGGSRWLLVEGTFNRHSKPPTLTAITDIVPFDLVGPDDWRQAIGCAPRAKDGQDNTASDALRKVRDG